MASLPPSQRRHSPNQLPADPEPSSRSVNRTDSEAHSTVSEDSQTILLNPSSVSSSRREKAEEKAQPPTQPTIQEVEDPRRCWICFNDETEDTPASSEWRSPCPCALEAHESCLLDWIADMEAPNSRKQRAPGDKILCPQCKSEIVLARPKSFVVDAVRGLEIFGSKLMLPGVLTVATSSFWYLCWVHGATSVMLVFGQRDGERVLAPLLRRPPVSETNFQAIIDHLKARWRLDIGLTLIPPMLIFSRTTLADGFLPILPMLFFVTKPDTDPLLDFGTWPPSAGLSYALLPYIRGLYNTYYERVWADHERRWLKEIQPRATAEAQEANNNGEDLVDGENVIEIDLDLGILGWEDEDDENENGEVAEGRVENGDNELPPLQAHPLHQPPLDINQPAIPADAAAPAPNIPRHRHRHQRPAPPIPDANPQPPAERNNFNLAVSTNRLAESILGALAFPAVSAVMGEVLYAVLPRSLTSKYGKQTGLLQARWGRSLVGGCLFVVLKDAVMLYVRWRMARDHRMRRVLDYKGKKMNRGGSGKVGRPDV